MRTITARNNDVLEAYILQVQCMLPIFELDQLPSQACACKCLGYTSTPIFMIISNNELHQGVYRQKKRNIHPRSNQVQRSQRVPCIGCQGSCKGYSAPSSCTNPIVYNIINYIHSDKEQCMMRNILYIGSELSMLYCMVAKA